MINYNDILLLLDDVLSKKEEEDENNWKIIFFQNKPTNSVNDFIYMQWQITAEITLITEYEI